MMKEQKQEKHLYPVGRRERIFGLAMALSAIFLANSMLLFGFALGFGLGVLLVVLCSVSYLVSWRKLPDVYSGILLGLSAVLAASFARSDDHTLNFWMVLLLLVSLNLTASMMAGQNLGHPGRLCSLLDAPRAFFYFGWGCIGASIGGLFHPNQTEKKKSSDGLVLGLILAAVVLAVLIPLLISADAAFEGLMAFLPEIELQQDELIPSLMVGGWAALVFYTQALALVREPKKAPKQSTKTAYLNRLTVNIVMSAVCGMYFLFLVSQLAYLTGGFAGLLPDGYTPAEYARRGFIEMACICVINLGLILFAASPVKQGSPSKLTRLLSLFIGGFSLFLVASASSRMNLYIHQFGLTRLRVLTEFFMVWLAMTTVTVCAWLYVPKLPYMKVVVVSALVLGGIVSWMDVDTQVAKYNVTAYASGALSTIDVDYLSQLSSGAVPSLLALMDAEDPAVAENAKIALTEKAWYDFGILESDGYDNPLTLREYKKCDLRGWSYGYSKAYDLLYDLAEAGKLQCSPRALDEGFDSGK